MRRARAGEPLWFRPRDAETWTPVTDLGIDHDEGRVMAGIRLAGETQFFTVEIGDELVANHTEPGGAE